MHWHPAPDIQSRLTFLVSDLALAHIKPDQLHCFRSSGSVSRARARIWSLPTIWQQALEIRPQYCIEVLSEKFDHLSMSDQDRVLIHELLHIPKTFSGALVPHRSHVHGRKTYRHYHDQVEDLFRRLTKRSLD